MKTTTWLELALFGAAPSICSIGECVSVRLLDLDCGEPCFAITFGQCWLCDNSGALTVFDSFASASLFLHLLKVDRFKPGERYNGNAWDLGCDDVCCYRFKGRRFFECWRKCSSTNTSHLSATTNYQKHKQKPMPKLPMRISTACSMFP